MENNRQQLLKHFAKTLRNLAIDDTVEISPLLLHYFSRKQLIEIIKVKYKGSIPKDLDLVEAENKDLLNIIEDELYVIAYATEKWSREVKKTEPKKPVIATSQASKKAEIKTEVISPKPNTKPNAKTKK